VQSVAVRLIVEKEREIKAFVPQEYWDIEATLLKDKDEFKAHLLKVNNKTLNKLF
jgi:DNA topoisomerase-1